MEEEQAWDRRGSLCDRKQQRGREEEEDNGTSVTQDRGKHHGGVSSGPTLAGKAGNRPKCREKSPPPWNSAPSEAPADLPRVHLHHGWQLAWGAGRMAVREPCVQAESRRVPMRRRRPGAFMRKGREGNDPPCRKAWPWVQRRQRGGADPKPRAQSASQAVSTACASRHSTVGSNAAEWRVFASCPEPRGDSPVRSRSSVMLRGTDAETEAWRG